VKKLIKKMNSVAVLLILFGIVTIQIPVKAQSTSFIRQTGFYRMKVGSFEITALLDGTLPQNLDELLKGAKPGEIKSIMAAHGETSIMNCDVNAYLINTGSKLILIDAGTADAYGPSLGHLTERLKEAGYNPGQIDAVLLTHCHMDHIGGLLSGDNIVFPNADIYISKREAEYYLSPANKEKAPEAMKPFFDSAIQKLGPIAKAGKLKTFEFGKELFPGVIAVQGLGHTAGHTFYVAKSKGQKIVFWGDIVLSDLVQFADLKVNSVYDYHDSVAAETRIQALSDAAKSRYWVAVSHIAFPGIGKIRRKGQGYHFTSSK
jgi:glyoxylase-like metal-dependent hydrolase (beta-lactamase superfamily II)